MELEKTIQMNMLFSFYGALLTEKQARYVAEYYEEDYTLAEIANNHGVSRQAIYDSIKRAEDSLTDYEEKLHLLKEFEAREKTLKKIKQHIREHYGNDEKINQLMNEIIQDSTREGN